MIYGGFAAIYDEFMDMDYKAWADYVQAVWAAHGALPALVLDLGCGTGGLTRELFARGYDMIGIDISAEMLAIARQRDGASLYLQQDMRQFELYGTVDAIVCTCDGFNYLADAAELAQTLALCKNYLNPGGILIFDINTEYKFEHILADNTFAAASDNAAYIWENFYDAAAKINEYAVTCFVEESGVYRRFEEVHFQKAHSHEEIKQAITAAGLTLAAVYGNMTTKPPIAESQRIFYVAAEK